MGKCQVCGTCCELYGHTVSLTEDDLDLWRRYDRKDLLNAAGETGELWVDAETGLQEGICPYLNRLGDDRAICSIEDVKPSLCKSYPTMAHGNRCSMGVLFKKRDD